ncbi:DctP family TRAP transporter solute-binding subunit [Marispirochaeta sp.]|uniref:DctP family TRAP transporter solute-binding subunit n=1 Tax=Marispirochaeta sp. TaxID=2038653 RepID=UPI0029C77637|nr:DctP family TRAP transporter solute-binding subunit [Marispirochaeta sp.]
MKKILMVMMAGIIAAGMIFAGGQGENGTEGPLTLTLGHGAAPSNPRHTVAIEMAAWIEEKSEGTLLLDVVPSETLGNDRQMAEAVSMGTLDLSINSQGPVATYNEKMSAVGMPFLFEKPENAYSVLDGDIGKELAEPLIAQGIRVLSYWDNGFRHITNNVRPIQNPEDLKGLKIRTPEDEITLAIFKTLGANPAPLAFGELYLALQQGVFDGQENPVTNIYFSNLHEVQKFLSLSNHKYEMCPLIVSESVWKTLSDSHKSILSEAALRFAKMHRQENNKLQNELLGEVKASGVAVNTADVPALRDATASVYDQFRPKFGSGFIDRLVKAASGK